MPLTIKRKQRTPQQQQSVTNPWTTITNHQPNAMNRNFQIADIYYGTLITGAAMKNLQRTRSIVANDDKYGIIAHRLMDSDYGTSFSLDIDTNKNKLNIIIRTTIFDGYEKEISTNLKFEWNFQE